MHEILLRLKEIYRRVRLEAEIYSYNKTLYLVKAKGQTGGIIYAPKLNLKKISQILNVRNNKIKGKYRFLVRK